MEYGYKKEVNLSFEDAEKKTREELIRENFGIITEINVRETFKKKLNVDFENYVILGACQPASALKVLQAERELGLLLPCNVIVYETFGKVYVSAIMPAALMKAVENKALSEIATEIEYKLKKVIESI